MLHLYNEKPISIFTTEKDVKIRVQFCNVKMKMKTCQFKHFYKYLTNLSKKIDVSTGSVDLLLVRDNLNITISLSHFLQLCSAVQTVMSKKFGLKSIYPN
ncbi:MAG: hypothetical protein CMF99_06195 [Candidatus Marinimicrobia bacterium]|nr:hypothetical protein [Candidatus Neomarinimicrobiota bacterium]